MANAPSIVHIIDRLVIGGMENGIVNILNSTSAEFDHKILCLRYSDPTFARRIHASNVEISALNKGEGSSPSYFRDVFRKLRSLNPTIVHTRNLPTIDLAPVIRLAGVKRHIHGEHGWDVLERDGGNLKYNAIRKLMSPMIGRYVCVSESIASWLTETVGVPERKVARIYNGVDTDKFCPRETNVESLIPIAARGDIVIGAVGRMEAVKDQITLVKAFIELVPQMGAKGKQLKLVIIGEGTLRAPSLELLKQAGLEDQAWLPGARDDVADILNALTVFVLPSANEGMSNTILEAMATGLPVIATAVGGNNELVAPGVTGVLIPPKDPDALCKALIRYATGELDAALHGSQARVQVMERFSLDQMITRYRQLYQLAAG